MTQARDKYNYELKHLYVDWPEYYEQKVLHVCISASPGVGAIVDYIPHDGFKE